MFDYLITYYGKEMEITKQLHEAYYSLEKISSKEFALQVEKEISSTKWWYDVKYEIKRINIACELLLKGMPQHIVFNALQLRIESEMNNE